MHKKGKKKFLIAFIGPVGSGKTFIARILAKKLNAVHVRTDDIRVALRKKGESYTSARAIANKLTEQTLAQGRSVVHDFDAVLSKRQKELQRRAQKFNARLVVIKVHTPEQTIIQRLKNKHYTKEDLFRNAEEATRVYFIRKKLHQKQLVGRQNFVINNAEPLRAQIKKIIKKLLGPMV